MTDMLQRLTYPEMRKEIAILNDELYQLPKGMREKCNERHREILKLYRDTIHKIQKKSQSNAISDTVATFATLGAMFWINYWYKDDGMLSMDRISDEIIKFVFRGLTGCDDVR